MYLWRIYLRVLGLLAPERKLAIVLALANLALACVLFIEPILFGRVVDDRRSDTVTIDNESAGRQATSYLLDLGHRRNLFEFQDAPAVPDIRLQNGAQLPLDDLPETPAG